MSSGIRNEGEDRRPVTLTRLAEMYDAGEPIAMITAYDFPSAQVIEEAGADIVLVGDSAANCVLGYDSTVPVGMDEMTMLRRRSVVDSRPPSWSETSLSVPTKVRTNWRSPAPSGWSRKPVVTPSSSKEAALRSKGRKRSSTPESR